MELMSPSAPWAYTIISGCFLSARGLSGCGAERRAVPVPVGDKEPSSDQDTAWRTWRVRRIKIWRQACWQGKTHVGG